MGGLFSAIFSGKPKRPKLKITQQAKPVEKVAQNEEKDKILKAYGKRRRATLLSSQTGQARVSSRPLGART